MPSALKEKIFKSWNAIWNSQYWIYWRCSGFHTACSKLKLKRKKVIMKFHFGRYSRGIQIWSTAIKNQNIILKFHNLRYGRCSKGIQAWISDSQLLPKLISGVQEREGFAVELFHLMHLGQVKNCSLHRSTHIRLCTEAQVNTKFRDFQQLK